MKDKEKEGQKQDVFPVSACGGGQSVSFRVLFLQRSLNSGVRGF